jgi:hypothetical protein
MTFTYVTAEYRCTKCSNAYSVYGIGLSVPYIIVSLLGTLPLSLILFRAPWNFPWYYFFSLVAGEFFLLFIAAFLAKLLVPTVSGAAGRQCPVCGATMTFRGQHITKSPNLRRIDRVLLVSFVALNLILGVVLLRFS